MSSERRRGTRLRERGALLGVLAIVGIADAAGAVTAIFVSDPEPGSCAAAEPAAVLVDASTPPIAGDPVPKYAPLVFFERQEVHLPMPADCFIEEAELSWARSSAAAAQIFEPVPDIDDARLGGSEGGYSVDDGGVFRSHEFTRPFAQGRARLTDRRGFFLDVDDRFRYGGDPAPALAGTPAYYEFVPGRYVTYWFFYGFSAPAGTKNAVAGMLGHEGDWERITVRLDGTEATEVAITSMAPGRRRSPTTRSRSGVPTRSSSAAEGATPRTGRPASSKSSQTGRVERARGGRGNSSRKRRSSPGTRSEGRGGWCVACPERSGRSGGGRAFRSATASSRGRRGPAARDRHRTTGFSMPRCRHRVRAFARHVSPLESRNS